MIRHANNTYEGCPTHNVAQLVRMGVKVEKSGEVKSEIRNKFECSNDTNSKRGPSPRKHMHCRNGGHGKAPIRPLRRVAQHCGRPCGRFGGYGLEHSDLRFWICFEFRISSFGFSDGNVGLQQGRKTPKPWELGLPTAI